MEHEQCFMNVNSTPSECESHGFNASFDKPHLLERASTLNLRYTLRRKVEQLCDFSMKSALLHGHSQSWRKLERKVHSQSGDTWRKSNTE